MVEYAEVLRVQDAQVLGTYGEDFYQGSAAITCKNHGKGNAWYVAARTDAPAMGPLFERMLADAGIPVRRLPAGVECHVRKGQEGRYEFYLNWTNDTAAISGVKGRDMVADREIEDVLELPAYGVAVVHSR